MIYIFKTLDVNGDGFIDFEDFTNALPSSRRATLEIIEGLTQAPTQKVSFSASAGRINASGTGSDYFPSEKEILAKQK